MARNPQWCQPLAVWRGYFSRWIDEPTEEAILRSRDPLRFPAGGRKPRPRGVLKAHLLHAVAGQGIFLKKMADLAVSVRPPLGFSRTSSCSGAASTRISSTSRRRCITPLINVVRLYGLQEGSPETSTLDRIHALREGSTVIGEFADELVQAYEFFLLLRIHHQYGQIQAGGAPDRLHQPEGALQPPEEDLPRLLPGHRHGPGLGLPAVQPRNEALGDALARAFRRLAVEAGRRQAADAAPRGRARTRDPDRGGRVRRLGHRS